MEARVEHELKMLEEAYPGVVIHRDPSGQHILEIPNFPLPPGWSKTTTTVLFRLPPAYPEGRPDCFWADVDLRLSNNDMPSNSNVQPEQQLSRPWLWFSWHVDRWAPGKDDLVKYVGVIARRFEKGV